MQKMVVIGAGIVGLACAVALQRRGAEVSIIERAPGGDRCSFGNAGGIATTEVIPASYPGVATKVPRWLLDPLGPLYLRLGHLPKMTEWLLEFVASGRSDRFQNIAKALADLNSQVYPSLSDLLTDIGLIDDLRLLGALSLYRTGSGFQSQSAHWDLRGELGIKWYEVSATELAVLEPALAGKFEKAVFLPEWTHVANPRRIVERLAKVFTERGGRIVAADAKCFRLEDGMAKSVVCENHIQVDADSFVVAAGAWSAALAATLGDRVLLESERGYNATLPSPGVDLTREIILAEQNYVMTPLEDGLRIGGAAEFSGLSAPPNYKRSDALLQLARQVFPELRTEGAVRWMGNRPTTPDSLPVIGRAAAASNVVYAFGHGHLGLTQAAPTADLVCGLIAGEDPPIDLTPFRAGRFRRDPAPLASTTRWR